MTLERDQRTDDLRGSSTNPAHERFSVDKRAGWVACSYLLFAGLWILFSDKAVEWLVSEQELQTKISIYKGLGFVVVTGWLLYQMVRRTLNQWLSEVETRRQLEAEKLDAAKRLLASDERLRLVLQATADGVWDWDLKNDQTYLSPRYWELCGYEPGEVPTTYEFFRKLIHPAHWEAVNSSLQEHIEGRTAQATCRYLMICKDGSEKWIWGRGQVVERTPEGAPLRMVGLISDITERRRAEETQAQLATVIEQAVEGIVTTDTSGTILYANPAFEKLTGYASAEVIGRKPSLLKSGRHEASFYANLWATLQRGEQWSGRFINRRKDGTHYEEDSRIFPVRDGAGTVVSYATVKRDVTHETQLEAQLRQSQKMEAIGQLAGGVAHDFNNILASILMQTDLIAMERTLAASTVEGLRQIAADSRRAADLTRQLLLFSRRQVMQSKLLNLNDVVVNLAKMLQRIIGEDVRLNLSLASVPLLVRGDAGMLEQILLNLAVNSRDAMPKGGSLGLDTFPAVLGGECTKRNPEALPGPYCCIKVSDTGTGIPPEIVPRIFEPFFTTKEAGKGTGLGLATVFGIAKQHRGWVELDNRPGSGAAFTVYLPASQPDPGASPELATVPDLRGGSETLLLVEDEPSVRKLTRAALQRHGYQVHEAIDGPSALVEWERCRDSIALLVTDLVMPGGVSGKELALRMVKEKPGLKVLYFSGYSAETAGRELLLGADENFLEKPFSTAGLLKAVRSCLDRTR